MGKDQSIEINDWSEADFGEWLPDWYAAYPRFWCEIEDYSNLVFLIKPKKMTMVLFAGEKTSARF